MATGPLGKVAPGIRRRLAISSAGVLALSAILTGCGASSNGASDATLNVGVLVSLSGAAAPYGSEELRAIKAVAAKENADGGIKGRKIKLIPYDTKTDPTEAARLAAKLVSGSHVVAIIGATTGSETLAFLNTAERAKVPVFPMVSTQSVTDPSKSSTQWVFRESIPLTADLPASFSRVVHDGKKHMAIFYQEDAYGEQTAAAVAKLADKAGVTVPTKVSAPLDATDLSTVASRLKAASPDSVFLGSSSPGLASALLRAMDNVGLDVPVYGQAGIVQQQIIDNGGKAAERLIADALVNPDDPGPLSRLFSLMKGNGGVSGFGALLGANAMATVAAGLETGATTGAELRDAVEKAGPIRGYAAAPIQYSKSDHEGWHKDTLFYVTVRDGKFVNLDD